MTKTLPASITIYDGKRWMRLYRKPQDHPNERITYLLSKGEREQQARNGAPLFQVALPAGYIDDD